MIKDDLYANILGSATAGIFGRLICHPIDTCKAKLQNGDHFKGSFDVISKTFRNEGIGGFYKGLGIVLVGGIPGICIYITTYEVCKEYLKTSFKSDASKSFEFFSYLLSGMIAETACCTLFVPVDVIKERLQVQYSQPDQKHHYRNGFHAFQTILKNEGLSGLYKGYFATLLSYGPFSALYFLLYEESKSVLSNYIRQQKQSTTAITQPSGPLSYECVSNATVLEDDKSTEKGPILPFQYNLICAMLSATFASIITNPLDLAKLRLQVHQNITEPIGNDRDLDMKYRNLSNVLREVYRRHGAMGLFRGTMLRVAFQAPSIAITMSLFEECKRFWKSSGWN